MRGRRGTAIAGASVAVATFHVLATFAPLVDALEWLRYASPWNRAFRGDAISEGPTAAGAAGLAVLALALIAAGTRLVSDRDLGA